MVKINVIDGGDLAARALIYKQPSSQLMDYLTSNVNQVVNAVKQYSSDFVNSVTSLKNKFHNNEIVSKVKSILNQSGMHFDQNVIYQVPYEQFHNANYIMRSFMMEHPEIRHKQNINMCYGFQDTYVDQEPDIKNPQDRHLYQQVMDGILQFELKEEQLSYINHYSKSEDELHVMDKISIIDTWDSMTRMLLEGRDPTDPEYNEF